MSSTPSPPTAPDRPGLTALSPRADLQPGGPNPGISQ